MSYPAGADYVDALQNPAMAFLDGGLKTGRLRCDQFGIPEPISGNFAAVFKVTAADGTRWAVKCFFRPVPEQERRYNEITTALHGLAHPALVDFKYQRHGIMVGGVRYPLLKMEWVDAQGLLPWLEQHRLDASRLAGLAEQLVRIVNDLEAAGIAHGDLQHGNLLVTAAGQLKLIDYDGMYVPALAGLPATEMGLPNYQPPTRTDLHFRAGLDRFSGWVIYTSLVALAVDPLLWRTVPGAGDDRLLFEASDYRDPAGSASLKALRVSGHAMLASLADLMTSIAGYEIDQMPSLDPTAVLRRPTIAVAAVQEAPTGLPGWMQNDAQIAGNGETPAPASATGARPAAPSPTQTVTTPLAQFTPGGHVTTARLGLAAGFLLAIGTLLAMMMHFLAMSTGVAAAGASTLLSVVVVAGAYRRHPQYAAHSGARAALTRVRVQIAKAQAALDDLNAKRSGVDGEERNRREAISRQRSQATKNLAAQHDSIQRELNLRLAQLDTTKSQLAASEAHRLNQILEQRRQDFINNRLRATSIRANPPERIGRQIIDRLQDHGFRTAADIVDCRISTPGRYETAYLRGPAGGYGVHVADVGPVRARALVEWRNRVYERALRDAPKVLEPHLAQAIRNEIGAAIQRCVRDAEAARVNARADRDAATQAERNRQITLDREEQATISEAANQRANLDRKLVGARGEVVRRQTDVTRACATADVYRKIRLRNFLKFALTARS